MPICHHLFVLLWPILEAPNDNHQRPIVSPKHASRKPNHKHTHFPFVGTKDCYHHLGLVNRHQPFYQYFLPGYQESLLDSLNLLHLHPDLLEFLHRRHITIVTVATWCFFTGKHIIHWHHHYPSGTTWWSSVKLRAHLSLAGVPSPRKTPTTGFLRSLPFLLRFLSIYIYVVSLIWRLQERYINPISKATP